MSTLRLMLMSAGLEPGINGVGDYCRRLAQTLAAAGVACDLLALNDPAVTDVAETTIETGRSPIHLVRIPQRLGPTERATIAKSVLSERVPDWVSLQFACYGFNPRGRGIVWREPHWLPQLLGRYRIEVMMHELWIGIRSTDPWHEKLIGRAQRFAILRLLRALRPALIHTSNLVFRSILAWNGLSAEILPLFGNIPLTGETATWLSGAIRQGCGMELDRPRTWIFGFFGGINPTWSGEALFDRISAMGQRAGREVAVVSIGEAGVHAASVIAQWRSRHPGIHFAMLGPRSTKDVSQFLNSIDFGLTTYPIDLLGKSGAAAAMLEHGVPIIGTWGDDPTCMPVWPPFAHLIWRNNETLEKRISCERSRLAPGPDFASFVADQFLRDIGKAQS